MRELLRIRLQLRYRVSYVCYKMYKNYWRLRVHGSVRILSDTAVSQIYNNIICAGKE